MLFCAYSSVGNVLHFEEALFPQGRTVKNKTGLSLNTLVSLLSSTQDSNVIGHLVTHSVVAYC